MFSRDTRGELLRGFFMPITFNTVIDVFIYIEGKSIYSDERCHTMRLVEACHGGDPK